MVRHAETEILLISAPHNSTPPITKGVGEGNPNVQFRKTSRAVFSTIRLRRIATNHGRFLPFSISATVCDNPRQSATAQTNQPEPTGSADRVVEHKGIVRRCLVFSRQGRARSAAYAVAQDRALVGQMFDARSCVKNNTGHCKKLYLSVSGNAFLRPLVLRG